MTDKQFDIFMKDILSRLNEEARPEDWVGMESMLNVLNSDGANLEAIEQFDRKSFSKLDKIQDDPSNADWTRMEQALNNDADLAKENEDVADPFDLTVAAALHGLTVSANASDWSQLNERIEADDSLNTSSSDQQLDDDAYTELSSVEVSQEHGDWEQMDYRLSEIDDVEANIIRNKALEALVMLLLLLTFIQIGPSLSPVSTPNTIVPSMAQVDQPNQLELNNTSKSEEQLITANNPVDLANAKVAEAQQIESNTGQDISSANAVSAESDRSNDLSSNAAEFNRSVLDNYLVPASNTYNSTKDWNVAATSLNSSSDAMSNTSILKEEKIISVDSRDILALAFNLDPIEIAPFSVVSEYLLQQPTFENISNPVDKIKGSPWSFSLYTTADFYHIVSPKNEDIPYDQYRRFGHAQKVGLRFGRELGNFNLSSGFAFTGAFDYTPVPVSEIVGGNSINGFITQDLIGAELSMVHVPLQLDYSFFKTEKWNLYGSLGASLSIVLEKDYQYVNDFSRYDPSVIGGSPVPPSIDLPITHGLSEGGAFAENHFIGLSAGLGIERLLGNGSSIFLEPSYSRSLFGAAVGPQRDRFHSIGITTGIKTKF